MTTNLNRVVIIGAGHAGAEAVAGLRAGGFDGAITLIGDEPTLPYQRPPLSKELLLGRTTLEDITTRPREFYTDHRIDLHLDVSAHRIDRYAQTVHLSDASEIPYDRLILATGGILRRHPDPSYDNCTNVHYLKTQHDTLTLQPHLRPGIRVGIIGGGFIGLEIAAAARKSGADVTLVERSTALLTRTCTPTISNYLNTLHRAEGVRLLLGSTATPARDDHRITGLHITTPDGASTLIDLDIIVIGIGIAPNTALAEDAGLAVDDGILVDHRQRTEDPRIWAVGDCARRNKTSSMPSVRLESAPNATATAQVAVADILGRPTPRAAAPWFWTTQYDTKLQFAGHPHHQTDQWVLRTTPAGLIHLGLLDDTIIRIEAIHSPAEFAQARKLLDTATPVDAKRLRDTAIPLRASAISPAPA